MKKVLLLLFAGILLIACSDQDIIDEQPTPISDVYSLTLELDGGKYFYNLAYFDEENLRRFISASSNGDSGKIVLEKQIVVLEANIGVRLNLEDLNHSFATYKITFKNSNGEITRFHEGTVGTGSSVIVTFNYNFIK